MVFVHRSIISSLIFLVSNGANGVEAIENIEVQSMFYPHRLLFIEQRPPHGMPGDHPQRLRSLGSGRGAVLSLFVIQEPAVDHPNLIPIVN
jgi:hypothetical protein